MRNDNIEKPLVSIIIPTYYRNETLASAIESAKNQTYENIEVIVVDDSGVSNAEPVANKYNTIYVAHDINRGAQQARSTGVEKSNGEYIQLLDDDDRLYPKKIQKQVAYLLSNPSIGAVYCGFNDRSGNDKLPAELDQESTLKRALMLSWPTALNVNFLIDAKILQNLLPNLRSRPADDLVMKIELAKETEFDYVSEVLVDVGKSEEHLSGGIDFVNDLCNIIEEYGYLYQQYPDEVKKEAKKTVYEWRCYRTLDDHVWSFRAICSIIKANYYSPSINIRLVGSAIASIFGRPGLKVSKKIYDYM